MLTIRPAVTTAPLLLRLASDRQIYDTNPAIRLALKSRRVRAEQFTPPPIARFAFRFFVSKPILIDDRANRDGLRPSRKRIAGKQVQHIDTPHVPHNWEAGLWFDETTSTLLAGDLLTHIGQCPALTESDCVAPALEAESIFHATGLTTDLRPTLEQLDRKSVV